MKDVCTVLDERQSPSMREVLGYLLAHARCADVAIRQLRLAGLNLAGTELGSLERCRIMIGELDAGVLFDDSFDPEPLVQFAGSGRLEIRKAPYHVWNPDFSVFTGLPRDRAVLLLGAHYFGRPYPCSGLAFTCVLTRRGAIDAARRRFEELWDAGYDVLSVVTEALVGL